LAQSLILAGAVTVDGQRATRPAQSVAADAPIDVQDCGPRFVSRGALKLARALDEWHIDPAGKVALDVGHGQLHYKLRVDPRVVSMERTNVRHLTELPERPALAVVDVSFISLRLALPPVFRLATEAIVALIKPQFEAGRQQVGKGGVVRDPNVHQQVVDGLIEWSTSQPWHLEAVVTSPITGPAGNIEFLSLWTPAGIISPGC